MHFQGIAGLVVLIGIAWALSEKKSEVSYKGVLAGLALQLVIALILLNVPVFKQIFLSLNRLVLSLEEATRAGTSFVFGYLGGAPLPFDEKSPGMSYTLAFQALPLVLVVGALSSLLFYWRILPAIVKVFSLLFQKTLNLGGALSLGASTTIFLGMVETPLLIKPYLLEMTRSELFSLMACGMASIAGTVMVLYSTILKGIIPDPLGHILIASLIHIPAAITVSRVMIPGTGEQTAGMLVPEQTAKSPLDAIARGTLDGLNLLFNIGALLIVAVALVNLVNQGLSLLPVIGGKAVTLQMLLGYVMAPIVWLFGIPWAEAQTAGYLMGTKTILNELLAFLELAKTPEAMLSPRSRLIMTYALCSFANFGSLGILIGGLGSLIPERRTEVVSLGIKAIIAGTLATCMTGAVVSLFV
ncbi:MAG TPA: nucleoside transporter C-terminal domain-containing protein [Candidatus Sulfobium mesophilum]|nr:nucleoside transporter C-terminal domain-containing protein [Candidatus Sulfobium mesophilum]